MNIHKIRLLLVEDDPFWCETMKSDLENEEEIVVSKVVSTKEEAVSCFCNKEVYDVVLMDLNLLEENDGLKATSEILSIDPNVKIIILTSLYQEDLIISAFENGVMNYLTKNNYQDLVYAIHDAFTYKEPSIHRDAAKYLRKEMILRNLSKEERKVYELKCLGFTKLQISNILHKSECTVKNQIKMINKKILYKKRGTHLWN
ncbi:response regulator transcription factor [Paenibacillus sp. FSL P2-0136]|uniref:response regulator transcription factor n=1 Tax=Paenibacillus sp. FSL P2-0136 TaxID=2975317 RepID=UPI0030D9F76E